MEGGGWGKVRLLNSSRDKKRKMEIRDGRREQIKRGWVCFWPHEFFKICCRVVNRRECNLCYVLFCQRKSVLFLCVCVCVLPARRHRWWGFSCQSLNLPTVKQTDLRHVSEDSARFISAASFSDWERRFKSELLRQRSSYVNHCSSSSGLK